MRHIILGIFYTFSLTIFTSFTVLEAPAIFAGGIVVDIIQEKTNKNGQFKVEICGASKGSLQIYRNGKEIIFIPFDIQNANCDTWTVDVTTWGSGTYTLIGISSINGSQDTAQTVIY